MSKKILVIEDDSILQEAIKTVLEAEGYVVAQAFNGEDGFNKIENENPDLILLDLIMPIKTGEWVLEQMNSKGLIDKYPLIVITVKNDMASLDNCISKFGVKNYLVKADYSLKSIAEKIRELLA